VSTLGDIVRDLILLGLLGVCVWLFPKTALAVEGVCGLGTLALFLFERSLFKRQS
jgi:hypothetical protein